MKLSNRILGFLLLFSIILAFYIFYQIFFKIKLTSLEINSNIENINLNLVNVKFSKDFFCKNKKCIITNIPPFKYKIYINKKKYRDYKNEIDISKTTKLNIFLEKKITLKNIDKEKLSKREMILKSNKNKLLFGNKKIIYNKIYGTNKYVYFNNLDINKVNFYNFKSNILFNIKFKPKINYIKKLSKNKFLINSEVGSFILDLLTKKIEYFSLFSDFISINNKYIGIINNDDIFRKRNFDLENESGNLLLSYNLETKEKYILKVFDKKINKIYTIEDNIFIEDNIGNKFELKGF